MGLDVSAYGGVRRVECDRWDDCYDEHVRFYPNSDFPAQADDLSDGCYEYAEELEDGPSRSYSGYNQWREWLSRTVLGASPEAVWDEPDAYAGKPFVELIHFSDCEGVIGPLTSAKLARDFDEHRDILQGATNIDKSTYERFAAAFKLASNNGAVSFH